MYYTGVGPLLALTIELQKIIQIGCFFLCRIKIINQHKKEAYLSLIDTTVSPIHQCLLYWSQTIQTQHMHLQEGITAGILNSFRLAAVEAAQATERQLRAFCPHQRQGGCASPRHPEPPPPTLHPFIC